MTIPVTTLWALFGQRDPVVDGSVMMLLLSIVFVAYVVLLLCCLFAVGAFGAGFRALRRRNQHNERTE